MSESTQTAQATVKQPITSVYVCRNAGDKDTKSFSCSIAVGAQLEITVRDCRTRQPVVGATPKRIQLTADSKELDWFKAGNTFLPSPVPKYQKRVDPERQALAENTKELEAAYEEQQVAFDVGDGEKVGELREKIIKLTAKREELIAAIQPRVTWVTFLQTALKVLGQYDGEIDGVLSEKFQAHLKEKYKQLTGKDWPAKGGWGQISFVLDKQVKRRFTTDDKGKLTIPLPVGAKGKVLIEFQHFKVLDPDAIEKTAPLKAAVKLDSEAEIAHRVDLDVSKVMTNDKYGSEVAESAWCYVCGDPEQTAPFQNFIEVPFETQSDGKPETLQVATLALVWCQPAWFETDEKMIWDPVVSGANRGLPHRGLASKVPTLVVCTKADHVYSKHYGVYGDEGRKRNGAFRLHAGVDLAGEEGDPVFALVGGKVTNTPSLKEVGRSLYVNPWLTEPPRFRLLHLVDDSIVPAVNDVIKAGDYVAKMGRTPGGGYFPGNSPTHAHFDCQRTLYSVPDAVDGVDAIFPHNKLPRIIPCGQEYADRTETNNPVGCNAERNAVAKNCWALRELACPFVPEKLKPADLVKDCPGASIRKLQTQLLFVYEHKNAAKKFRHPGGIDGDIGHGENTVTVKGSARARTVWTTGNKLLFQASAGEVFTIVDVDNLAHGRRKVALTAAHVEKYKDSVKEGQSIAAGDTVCIHPTQVTTKMVGSTRKAIKAFRAATINKDQELTDKEWYSADQPLIDELDKPEYAKWKTQKPSDPVE